MRLTLRSLLAYLDDILEAPDAEDLGHQIEDSDFARTLVHRMRSATRRLRLGAPKLSGKGMGLDPNTVAEYLDYTLTSTRVPDFEKVCLESDVHLAEVAACHQILTMVLGGVADVDSHLRDRVLQLGNPDEVASATQRKRRSSKRNGQRVKTPDARTEPTTIGSFAPNDSISYATRKSGLNRTAVFVVAALAIGLTLIVLGPLDERHPLFGRLFDEQPTVASNLPTEVDSAAAKQNTDASDGSSATGVPPNQEIAADKEETAIVVKRQEKPEVAPGENTTELIPARPEVRTADPETPKPATDKVAPMEDPKPQQKTATDEPPQPNTDPEPMVLPESRIVAKLTSSNQILARMNPEDQNFFRVPSLATLDRSDQLFVPPLFRPQLVIMGDSGLQMTVVGPAQLTLPDSLNPEMTKFVFQSGRAVFVRNGTQFPVCEIEFGDQVFRLSMKPPSTMMAIELDHYLPPGENPVANSAWNIMKVYGLDGPVEVDSANMESLVVDPQQEFLQVDDKPPIVRNLDEAPKWIQGKAQTSLDRFAADEIEQLLENPTRPMMLALHEASGHRRVEVRSLAVQSLASVGEYWPFVDAIGDRKLHPYWQRDIKAIQQSMIDRSENAVKLQKVLKQRRGADGDVLFRMLWGYNNDQLAAGEDRTLVRYIEHDALDLRVVAFDQLQQITGLSYLFRPDRPLSGQRSELHQWRKAATNGEIRYRKSSIPQWLQPLVPLDKPDDSTDS